MCDSILLRKSRSFHDYLCLRDAVALIGARLVVDWRETDLDELSKPDNYEAHDRVEMARARLIALLEGGMLRAFGQDDEGAFVELERERLSKPFFDIDIPRSYFRWAHDGWDVIFVSRSDLKRRLDELVPSKARKSVTFDWCEISCVAWKLALDDPQLRKSGRLIDAVQRHFAEVHDQHPDDKELRELALTIIDHLGDRILSREVSQPETSSDAPPDSV